MGPALRLLDALVLLLAGGVPLAAKAGAGSEAGASLEFVREIQARLISVAGEDQAALSQVNTSLNENVAIARAVHTVPPRIELNPRFLAAFSDRSAESILALVVGHELGHVILGADSDEILAEQVGVRLAGAAGLSINIAFSITKNPIASIYAEPHESYVKALKRLVRCGEGSEKPEDCLEAGVEATTTCVMLEELTLRESQLYQMARIRNSLGSAFHRVREFSCVSHLSRVRNTVILSTGDDSYDVEPRVVDARARLDELAAWSAALAELPSDGHELRPFSESWLPSAAQMFSATFQVAQRAGGEWALGWEASPLGVLVRTPVFPVGSRLAYGESYATSTVSRGLSVQLVAYPALVSVGPCRASLCGVLALGIRLGGSYEWLLDRERILSHGAALIGGGGAELDFGLERSDPLSRSRSHFGLGLWAQYPLLGLRATGLTLGLQARLAF